MSGVRSSDVWVKDVALPSRKLAQFCRICAVPEGGVVGEKVNDPVLVLALFSGNRSDPLYCWRSERAG